MITAHLPSGYVLGRLLKPAPLILPAALLGGVFPDFDLIWFYSIDNRAFHHHRYWVHAPGLWLLVAAITLPFIYALKRKLLAPAATFHAAVFLHIGLDSIAGDVMWLWPFSTERHSLISIPAVYSHWILNFILHPVFALELAIWCAAFYLWLRRS